MSDPIAIFIELSVGPSLLLQVVRIGAECKLKGSLFWNLASTGFNELVKQGNSCGNPILLGGSDGQEMISEREVIVCTGIWRKDCVLQQLVVLVQDYCSLLFRNKVTSATDSDFKVRGMRKQLD